MVMDHSPVVPVHTYRYIRIGIYVLYCLNFTVLNFSMFCASALTDAKDCWETTSVAARFQHHLAIHSPGTVVDKNMESQSLDLFTHLRMCSYTVVYRLAYVYI